MSKSCVISVVLAGCTLISTSCVNQASKLPVYDSVPQFTAADSHGKPFTRADMNGKTWVVDFIYATCPAACPLMSSRLMKVASDVKLHSDVKFLSISIDPERDTPAALQGFAQRYGGGNKQWIFLAANADTVHRLAFQTFHTGDVLGKIEHSTKFAIVDKNGQIRGYYSSGDSDDLVKLKQDIKILRGM